MTEHPSEPAAVDAPEPGSRALAGDLPAALARVSEPDGPQAAWERGWVLAAMGRYGPALDALAEAAAGRTAVAAAAALTRASVFRQLSLHRHAEPEDQRALELAVAPAQRLSALIGLVADAVGIEPGSAAMHQRLAEAERSADEAPGWRQATRLAWVTGEVAMSERRWEDAAIPFARAREIAAAAGARRHEAKSLLFLAAAAAARHEQQEALEHARLALRLAEECRADPLQWPSHLVLGEVIHEVREAANHVRAAKAILRDSIDTLREPLRTEALIQDPASWLVPPVIEGVTGYA